MIVRPLALLELCNTGTLEFLEGFFLSSATLGLVWGERWGGFHWFGFVQGLGRALFEGAWLEGGLGGGAGGSVWFLVWFEGFLVWAGIWFGIVWD